MKMLPASVEEILAVLGLASTVWSVALALFTTHKSEATVRRVAVHLRLEFVEMAIELGRKRNLEDARPRPDA